MSEPTGASASWVGLRLHEINARTGRCLWRCKHEEHDAPRQRCAACKDLAVGYAKVNGLRLCHGTERTCYVPFASGDS